MRRKRVPLGGAPLVLLFFLFFAALIPQTQAAPPPEGAAAVRASYARLPLHFEPNRGQADAAVRFLARGPNYTLALTPTEAILSLPHGKATEPTRRSAGTSAAMTARPSSAVRLQLVGSNRAAVPAGTDELPGKVNYLRGNDPAQWRTNVPTFARVAYREVYPGVDLVYYGNQGQLEHDFLVAPGADPRRIAFTVQGARTVRLDARGDLVLRLPGGDLRLRKPVAYQEIAGTKQPRSARFTLQPGPRRGTPRIGFRLGAYDRTRPLVIDPVLVYSTYLGGSGYDEGHGITLDGAGNAYVTGNTRSSDFPAEEPFQASRGVAPDAFVSKLNAAGSALVYSTYLGGNGSDTGYAIAVDADGSAYVTGSTQSANFPTASPLQGTRSGTADAFVAKLNAAGSALVYSTYLGGSGSDNGYAIAIDTAGNAYVAGDTLSANFPTILPLQAGLGGKNDAFVAKLNAAGSAILYSTYLGGDGVDWGASIAVDAAGSAYVAGITISRDFPTVSPFQGGYGGAGGDVFVAMITTALPGVLITSPTEAPVHATTALTLDLAGIASASDDGAVVQVTWTNDRGGSGIATGTTAWSVTGIPLQQGANILTVTAHDAGGNTSTDTLAVAANAVPIRPSSRHQRHADGVTNIPLGGNAATTVIFVGTVSDTYPEEMVRLQVEARPIGSAFTGNMSCQSALVPSGTAASCAVSGLMLGTRYHWQTRTVDSLGIASAWASYAMNAETEADFIVNTRPSVPMSRGQRQADGVTVIPLGGFAGMPIVFRATVSDPDAGQWARIQVEVQPVGVPFTGTVSCQSNLVPSGNAATCSVSGLAGGTSHHWRLRTVDSVGSASAWVSYATNPETEADFVVNVTPFAPTGPGQREADGTTPIPVGGTTSSGTVVFRAKVTDPNPGQRIRLQVEVQPVGTNFTGTVSCQSGLVANGMPAMCSVGGLIPGTGYHWWARAVDSVGATGVWRRYAANPEAEADFVVGTPGP